VIPVVIAWKLVEGSRHKASIARCYRLDPQFKRSFATFSSITPAHKPGAILS
jgi:hypothetical protein